MSMVTPVAHVPDGTLATVSTTVELVMSTTEMEFAYGCVRARTVRTERHALKIGAGCDRRDSQLDIVGDNGDLARQPVRYHGPPPVRREHGVAPERADLDRRDLERIRREIDDRDVVRAAVGDVGSAAIGRDRDGARKVLHRHGRDDRIRRRIEYCHLVGV